MSEHGLKVGTNPPGRGNNCFLESIHWLLYGNFQWEEHWPRAREDAKQAGLTHKADIAESMKMEVADIEGELEANLEEGRMWENIGVYGFALHIQRLIMVIAEEGDQILCHGAAEDTELLRVGFFGRHYFPLVNK